MNTSSDDKDTDAKVKEIMENATAKKEETAPNGEETVDLGALSVGAEKETADTPTLDLGALTPEPKISETKISDLGTTDVQEEQTADSKTVADDATDKQADVEDSFNQKVFRAEKSDDLFDTFDQELDSFDGDYGDKYQKKSGTSFYTLMAGVAIFGGLLGAVAVYIFDDKPSDPAFSQTKAPVIRPVEATKVKPESPGGLNVKNKDVDVYSTVANKKEEEKQVQVVEPEKPALPKQSDEQTTQPIANAPKAVEVKPAPVAEKKPEQAPTGTTETQTAQADTTPAVKPLALKVEQAAQAAAEAKKEQATAETKPVIPANYALQLASVRSQKQAEDLWAQTLQTAGDLLADKELRIETINLKDKGDFFRVLAVPFADSASAKALCTELKRNKIDCLTRKLKK